MAWFGLGWSYRSPYQESDWKFILEGRADRIFGWIWIINVSNVWWMSRLYVM